MRRDRKVERDRMAGTTGAVQRPPASRVPGDLPETGFVAVHAPGRAATSFLVRAALPCALAVAWLARPGFDATAWFAAVALGAMSLPGRRFLATPAEPGGRAVQRTIRCGGSFVLRWTLGATLFGAIAFAAAFDTGGVPFIAYGLILGLPQWLLLRPRLHRPGWWLAVTAAIWPIAALTGLEFLYLAGPLGPLAGGFMVGAAQWLVLAAANGLPRAWTWVAASAVAWASDAWVSMICAAAALPPQPAGAGPGQLVLASLGVGAAGGLAYGVVSGFALSRLLGRGGGGDTVEGTAVAGGVVACTRDER